MFCWRMLKIKIYGLLKLTLTLNLKMENWGLKINEKKKQPLTHKRKDTD